MLSDNNLEHFASAAARLQALTPREWIAPSNSADLRYVITRALDVAAELQERRTSEGQE